MKNKAVKIVMIVGMIIIIAVIAGVAVYNCIRCPSSFFSASLVQCLTLIVAIVFAFWAVQRKTDERKIKEEIERVVRKIQEIVDDTGFCSFPAEGNVDDIKQKTMMAVRRLKNFINVLNEYNKKFDIKDEITYIEGQLNEYNGFVSEHYNDLDYLSKSQNQLRRYSENINSKCDYIIVKLFTKL